MPYHKDYLKSLANIETPIAMYPNEQPDMDEDYCDLRKAVKDLLENPEDKEAEETISNLIKILDLVN